MSPRPSRFLNVISLFNGALPVIAIQMQAFAIGKHVTLIFTTVLDERVRGTVNEDDNVAAADRAYWETRSSEAVVSMADNLLGLIHEFDESIDLNYNRNYIGLVKEGRPFNFVSFRPRRDDIVLRVMMPRDEDLEEQIGSEDIETLSYSRGMYRLRITNDDLTSKSDFIKELMGMAYARRARP